MPDVIQPARSRTLQAYRAIISATRAGRLATELDIAAAAGVTRSRGGPLRTRFASARG